LDIVIVRINVIIHFLFLINIFYEVFFTVVEVDESDDVSVEEKNTPPAARPESPLLA